MNLSLLVDLLLKEYIGGKTFFSKLDKEIRKNSAYLSHMINVVSEKEMFDYIIVSGNFGKYFKRYCEKTKLLNNIIIWVNGALREDKDIIPFWNKYDILNKKIIFIDDSFYSGKTRDKIKEAILNNRGIFLKTYVFYDGSKIKDDDVISFYRYYDHY